MPEVKVTLRKDLPLLGAPPHHPPGPKKRASATAQSEEPAFAIPKHLAKLFAIQPGMDVSKNVLKQIAFAMEQSDNAEERKAASQIKRQIGLHT